MWQGLILLRKGAVMNCENRSEILGPAEFIYNID